MSISSSTTTSPSEELSAQPSALPSASSAADILIVGAGPAGATLSIFLSQAKIPHTIIDKATFPRDKADGNVYGTKVVEVLNLLSPDYLSELAAQANHFLGCDVAQIFTPNGNRFNMRFPHDNKVAEADRDAGGATSPNQPTDQDAPCFTMNRRDFDYFLVKKLDDCYAHQRFGTSLKAIERKKTPQGRWQVILEHDGETTELSPQLIVAADGVNSTFLQAIDCQMPDERYCDTVQGYFRGVTGFEEEDRARASDQANGQTNGQYFHFEGHFLPESTPGFFFVVPLANGIFNVGVGKPRADVAENNVDLSQLLNDIIHKHPQFSERFAQAEPVGDLRLWPLAAGATNRASISGDGYMVIGDAAGLCTPLTYFGTGNAMISGMLAAEQIQRSVSQASFGFDAETLISYDRAVYGRLQTEFQAANLTRSFIKRNWLFNLMSSNTPVKSVLRRGLKKTSTMLKRL